MFIRFLLIVCVICSIAAKAKEPEKTYRAGFIAGNFKIALMYTTVSEKPKQKEFGGCQSIIIGFPDDWELMSVQSFGRELHCYDVLFKLKDGSRKLCRLDLRSFEDTSRNENIELKFKDESGVLDFVPQSRLK